MFKLGEKLNLQKLTEIAHEFRAYYTSNDESFFANHFDFDNSFGTKFYKFDNHTTLNQAEVYTVNGKLTSLRLVGDIDITYEELVALHSEKTREFYSSRDELFFYFFGENDQGEPSFFIRSEINLSNCTNEKITNIGIRWKD